MLGGYLWSRAIFGCHVNLEVCECGASPKRKEILFRYRWGQGDYLSCSNHDNDTFWIQNFCSVSSSNCAFIWSTQAHTYLCKKTTYTVRPIKRTKKKYRLQRSGALYQKIVFLILDLTLLGYLVLGCLEAFVSKWGWRTQKFEKGQNPQITPFLYK